MPDVAELLYAGDSPVPWTVARPRPDARHVHWPPRGQCSFCGDPTRSALRRQARMDVWEIAQTTARTIQRQRYRSVKG